MNKAFDQTQVTTPNTSEQVSNFVRATGRTRKAGYWLCGSGVALILSVFLPWVSIDGMGDTGQSGGGVLVLLAIGGLLAYLGGRVLQDRISKRVNVALWVLAAVGTFYTVALFAAQALLQQNGAQPAIGFYLGLGGFIAAVVGTVLMQTAQRKNAATAQSVESGR